VKLDPKGLNQNVKYLRAYICRVLANLVFAVFIIHAVALEAQPAAQPPETGEIRIVAIQGTVEIMPAGATTWVLTQTNQVLHPADRLRTGSDSRVTLLWCDQSAVPLGALTQIEILAPNNADSLPSLQVVEGIVSFFHRDKPGRIRILTHGANASVEGTELVMEVAQTNGTEQTTLSVVDGKVKLSNPQGTILLTNSEQAVAEPGKAPVHTAGFIANNLLQWCFYYPAVLDLNDLSLSPTEEQALTKSLDAYRAGDLLDALANCPASASSDSDAQRIYHAALLLSVGQVEQTESELASLTTTSPTDRIQRLANSLRTLIAAVKRQPQPTMLEPILPTEFLAASYYEQSRANVEQSLTKALDLARRAKDISPQFSFAWSRVAEIEFGFGRTEDAAAALDTSLKLSPRNAQSAALKGFTLAAQNKTRDAVEWFNRALSFDSALANAWLGRGLCRIRSGDTAGGRADLLVAAAMEPQRSLLRSYLGKAFADAGNDAQADHEIQQAIKLDPNDPTAWLYLALLRQQENRVNEAIQDLDNSQAKNDNRSLFRSRLLLDQDQAVASANLASIYHDAGMSDVSVREAASAVNDDYANASAHLFLSDAYNELRDPTQFNLRYETVWFNELLLANLLAPVGGGRLSQEVSQQEYSKLFQQDGLSLASSTDVRSDGMYHQQASQYGTFGNTSYALDLDYHHNDGVRVNNGLDDIEWDTTIKQQVTSHDTALLLVQYQDYHSGDNFQYYNPANARPNYKFDEYQQPILVGGWDHEWSPGIRTLMLVGRLTDEQDFSDKAAPQLVLNEYPNGTISGVGSEPYDVNYHNQFQIYSAELNQICEWDRATLSAGARYQSGTFQAQEQMGNTPLPVLFTPTTYSISENFERITGYGYLTVEPLEHLWLTGGFAYDQVTYPDNYRQPPVSSGEAESSQLGPKAALVWSPIPQATLRGVYTRSLGGVSLDESYRLEPTQLAGFPQAFRSLISESIVGSVSAPSYETLGVALDLKLGPRTFAGIQAERLTTDVQRNDGDFVLQNGVSPGSTPETLNYKEYDLSASLNQLVGDKIVLGTSYSITRSDLNDVLTDIPVSMLATANQMEQSTLQQAEGYIQFNHPSGFFARAEAHWYGQSNSGWTPAEPGDHFFQYNLFAGYYFMHRRAELQLGILNLTGGNYNLNPLTPYQELPISRVFEAKLNFVF
jgi:Tfp pilus assembly protein PilF